MPVKVNINGRKIFLEVTNKIKTFQNNKEQINKFSIDKNYYINHKPI
jgi:hypothetical protein